MEEQYAGNLSANEIEQSYNGGEIVPIYTSDQLEKVGSGETVYVAETGKIYTFSDDKSYLFYGQSEDLTAILNELIDQRLSELTGSSTGKSTLLWEKELDTSASTNEYIETTIQVEALDKYKHIYFSAMVQSEEFGEWSPLAELGASGYIPMQIIKENNDLYYGPAFTLRAKYIDSSNLGINYVDINYGHAVKYQIYGVE